MVENLDVYGSVKKWFTKLEAKSRSGDFNKSSSKRAGLYWLGKYLTFLSTTPNRPTNPDTLIAERLNQKPSSNIETRRIQEEYFEQWIVQLKRDEYSPNSIATATGIVRSFYKANYGSLEEVSTIRPHKVRAFKVPSPKDLKKMCDQAPLPLKTWILCQKDSGLGNADLQGLSLSNLSSEFGTIKTQLKKGTIPIHIEINRGKTGERTDSFFGPNSVKVLKEYVNVGGGRIFRSSINPNRPISIRAIQQQVKSLAIKAKVATREVPVTPYKLRVFFNTYMKMAGVNESVVERMMGHSIGRVRSAYLVTGRDENVQGMPISKLAEVYMQAYSAIDIESS